MRVDFTALLLSLEIAQYEMTLAERRKDTVREHFARGRLSTLKEIIEEWSPFESAATISLLRNAKEAGTRRALSEALS